MSFAQSLFKVSVGLPYFMLVGLVVALVLRYIASKAGQRHESYFNSFSKGVEKILGSDSKWEKVEDIDNWMSRILAKVTEHLPSRSLRYSGMNLGRNTLRGATQKEGFADFVEGRQSISHSIASHIDAFKSATQPDFVELTDRILDQDKLWKNIGGVIPADTLSRFLDILPGLFVVCGILGTFIGVASGLPKIASIDLEHMETVGPLLNSFVKEIAFAMNSSVVGILCSLIMTILNGLFPLAQVRISVEKNLEVCLESIWRRLHGQRYSPAESRMIELLETLCRGQTANTGKPASRVA